MSRRPAPIPADLPSADDLFGSSELWDAAGAGGEWPWKPASRVYFLKDAGTGLIRIGIAKNMDARIASHQSSNAGKLEWLGDMPGGRQLERQIHEAFAHARSHGSWYRPENDIVSAINRMIVL
jgi:hypothetical protein